MEAFRILLLIFQLLLHFEYISSQSSVLLSLIPLHPFGNKGWGSLPLGLWSYARLSVLCGLSCQKLFAIQKVIIADSNINYKVLFHFTSNYFIWYSEQLCEVDWTGSKK